MGQWSKVKGTKVELSPWEEVYTIDCPQKLAEQYIIVEIYRNIPRTDTMSVCDTNKHMTSQPTNDVVSQGSFKPLFQGDYPMT